MSLTIAQQKKHLLLLNRLHRTALKAELIPTPSKLSDDKVEKLFNEFFKKKDNYYIPKITSTILKINEEEFKKLYKEPKKAMKKEEVKPKEEPKKAMKKEEVKPKEEPKKEEPKEEPKKEEPKKEEPKENLNELKKKIIKGIYLYVNKNYDELYKLYSSPYKLEEEVNDNRLYDLFNDNIYNWFDKSTSTGYYEIYNLLKKYNKTKILNYILNLLEIEKISGQMKNKLKNLKVISVDEVQYMKLINRKQKTPTNIFDIGFRKLSNDSLFRKQTDRIKLDLEKNKDDYKDDLLTYKNLPDEKQILKILNDNNIDFDYFIYIYYRGESTPHTGIIPKKEFDGKGYNIKDRFLYNKKGDLIAKFDDNSIFKNLVKALS